MTEPLNGGMEMLKQNRTLSRNLGLLGAIIVLVSIFTSISSAEGGEKWTPAPSNASCPATGLSSGCSGNEICAEWDVEGEPLASCCILPQYLGTSNFEACSSGS